MKVCKYKTKLVANRFLQLLEPIVDFLLVGGCVIVVQQEDRLVDGFQGGLRIHVYLSRRLPSVCQTLVIKRREF